MNLLRSLTRWFDITQIVAYYTLYAGDGGGGDGGGGDGGAGDGNGAGDGDGDGAGDGASGDAGDGAGGAGDGAGNAVKSNNAAQAAASQQAPVSAPAGYAAPATGAAGSMPNLVAPLMGSGNIATAGSASPVAAGGGNFVASPLATYDPYSPYRAQAATQLNTLVNNPSLAMSSPGYQAQLNAGMGAAESRAAATGQSQSGGELAQLNQLGQNTFSAYYNNMFNQLSQLSGASQSPATATAAQNSAQTAGFLAPYQGGSLASSAQLASTQANIAGYLAPTTAAQTTAQTGVLGAQTGLIGAQTAYQSGAATDLAEAQASAAQKNASSNQVSAIGGLFSGANSAVGGLGGLVGGIAGLFGL